MSFSIRTKLFLASPILLLPLIVFVIISHYNLKTVYDTQKNIIAISEEMQIISDLQLALDTILMPANDYIITGNKKYIANFWKTSRNLRGMMHRLEGIKKEKTYPSGVLYNGNQIELFKEVCTSVHHIRKISVKIFAIREPVGNRDAAKLMEEVDYKWAYPIIKKLEILNSIEKNRCSDAINTSAKNWERFWVIRNVSFSILLVMGTFYILFFSNRFVRPIIAILEQANAIARGNFTIRDDIKTGDELEQLSNAMNEMSMKLNELTSKLGRLSITDKLTSLYNRRYFDEALEKEVLRAKRSKHALCLLFIDIDKFKHLNDTYGHHEGDKVLQNLGVLIKTHVRDKVDIACRYGGEEFVVILPETECRNAITLAERIRANFSNLKFYISSANKTIQKTISIGITDFTLASDANSMIVNADKAMYKAKKLGGDKVCVC